MIADSAMLGYTCNIFMLRKLSDFGGRRSRPGSSDDAVADSPYMYNAAHHIIAVTNFFLEKFPSSGTMSILFGVYQCQISFAYLASTTPSSEDVRLLEEVAASVAKVTKDEPDFIPLSQALHKLILEFRRQTAGDSDGRAVSKPT
jgi:hypothetical protein